MKQIVTTVDRFEGEYAVLRHKDHEILLPKEDLPEGVTEGGVVALTVMEEKQVEEERTETAKTLLNDILNDALRQGIDTRPEAEKLRHKEVETIQKESKSLEDTTKKIEDENKKLEDLGKKVDDLNKKLKG